MSWPQPIIRAGRVTDDLECLRGDSMLSELSFSEFDESTGVSTPYDFDLAYSALFQVRDEAALVALEASTSDGTLWLGTGTESDVIGFDVPAATTALLSPATYVCDLQVTWKDGTVETLILPCKFVVLADVSR